MTTMNNPLAIANFFIGKSLETGIEVTSMKLNKLVYLAHGWYLGLTGEPLITEGVEAWKYGPVVPSLYHKFKSYGGNRITSLASIVEGGSEIFPSVNSEKAIPLLNRVWEIYSELDGLRLSTLTHRPGTPWDITWNQQGGKSYQSFPIPNDLIMDHYKTLSNANAAAAN